MVVRGFNPCTQEAEEIHENKTQYLETVTHPLQLKFLQPSRIALLAMNEVFNTANLWEMVHGQTVMCSALSTIVLQAQRKDCPLGQLQESMVSGERPGCT